VADSRNKMIKTLTESTAALRTGASQIQQLHQTTGCSIVTKEHTLRSYRLRSAGTQMQRRVVRSSITRASIAPSECEILQERFSNVQGHIGACVTSGEDSRPSAGAVLPVTLFSFFGGRAKVNLRRRGWHQQLRQTCFRSVLEVNRSSPESTGARCGPRISTVLSKLHVLRNMYETSLGARLQI
jgi:hypothetical protein